SPAPATAPAGRLQTRSCARAQSGVAGAVLRRHSDQIIPKRGALHGNLGENAVSANATRRLPHPLTTSSAGISSENSVPVPAVGSTESVQALTASSERVRARP